MPKIKKGKRHTKTKNSYTEEVIQKALQEIRNGGSKNGISKKYSIPRATLQFRLSDKFKKISHGPNPYLTNEEEKTLVQWIIDSSRKGFPRRKNDIVCSVREFLTLNERPNPFKDNTPGYHWYKAFLRRNPIITERTSEAVTPASSNISKRDIEKWFDNIKNVLLDEGVANILDNPIRVFNGDETSFLLNPNNSKVLAPKGEKNVYEVDRGLAKSAITAMFTFSAAGVMVPPMLIFPYKRIPQDIQDSVPGEWGIGRSDSGWMRAEVFYEYIANHFHPFLVSSKIDLPIILFVDGHKSHISKSLSDLCSEIGIHLVALYPNATRLLQPADVAAFRPLKEGWRKGILEFRRQFPEKEVTRVNVAPILKMVIKKYVSTDTLKNGFRACGLFPWNPNNIDFSKCLGHVNIAIEEINPEQSLTTSALSSKMLSYEMFHEIVGKDLLQKLSHVESSEDNSESFICLRNIFEYFNPIMASSSVNQINDLNSDIDHIDLSLCSQNKSDLQQSIQDVQLETWQNSENICNSQIITESCDRTPGLASAENTIGFQQPSCIQTEKIAKVTRNLFAESPKSLNLKEQHSSLKSILHWPESPKRKGKRQVERMPYVLTSRVWKAYQESKIEKKNQAEIEKQNRKAVRMEKKKLSTRKRSNHTNITLPSTSTGHIDLCYACGSTISKNCLTCSNCHKKYHLKCIPKNFQENIPDPEDFLLFVCHKCMLLGKSDDSLSHSE